MRLSVPYLEKTVDDNTEIVSKVLIHDVSDEAKLQLKVFCQANNLIGLVDNSKDIFEILKSNIDLGAVIIGEGKDAGGTSGIELSQKIHELRPELPIIVRVEDVNDTHKIEANKAIFAYHYDLDNINLSKWLLIIFYLVGTTQ